MKQKQTFREALNRASFCLKKAGLVNPRQEAEFLMMHAAQVDRLQLFNASDQLLKPETEDIYMQLVSRRCKGEPSAYITGYKYFYGLPFAVNRSVLIPRPETEIIIDAALEWAQENQLAAGKGVSALDMGTGSGCLAVTLAVKLPLACIYGVDSSEGALLIAAKNAENHGVGASIRWEQGSYFEPLDLVKPKPQFNLIMANPPYISSEEMQSLPAAVKDYEPLSALNGGSDGLDGYRSIIEALPCYLKAPGLALFEIGAGQDRALYRMARDAALFKTVTFYHDLGGWPRVMECSF